MNELTQIEILNWLREQDPARLQELYSLADSVRKENVGDAIHLRGLIEISSHCERQCMYCGLRRGNTALFRYRMSAEEILACALEAKRLGYGTVVIQAGEDRELTADFIAGLVRRIKSLTGLAVTLSLGERAEEELSLWREAGADRYLLRFETSDLKLFRLIHPPRRPGAPDRIELLGRLKRLGYEVGSGVMVGIPGQSYASLAHDISVFRALDLDMIGIGPYIPHSATPLGSGALCPPIEPDQQVPATEEMVLKTVALARLACPTANLPSTTALATIDKAWGRRRGLSVGGNVAMPNLTPVEYRALYQIYPAKACIDERPSDCNQCLRSQIHSLGRYAGSGPGGRGAHENSLAAIDPAAAQLVQLAS